MENPRSRASQDKLGQVAQLVEQRIENPRVGGSIPPLATRYKNARCCGRFCIWALRAITTEFD